LPCGWAKITEVATYMYETHGPDIETVR